MIALRFTRPSLVAFTADRDAEGLDPDWPRELQEDRLEPFSINHDEFTLTSDASIAEMVKDCVPHFLVGHAAELSGGRTPVRLGFRSGPVGLVVRAEQLVVLSTAGELTPERIIEAAEAWWQYWQEYWRRRTMRIRTGSPKSLKPPYRLLPRF